MADEQLVIGVIGRFIDDIALADPRAAGDEYRETLRDIQREQFFQLRGRDLHDGFPEKRKPQKDHAHRDDGPSGAMRLAGLAGESMRRGRG